MPKLNQTVTENKNTIQKLLLMLRVVAIKYFFNSFIFAGSAVIVVKTNHWQG